MSARREDPSKMMRAATGLHRNDAGWKLCRQRDQRLSLGAPPQHHFSGTYGPPRLQAA